MNNILHGPMLLLPYHRAAFRRSTLTGFFHSAILGLNIFFA